MFKNLKLGAKMGLGFGIIIALVLAVGAVTVLNMVEIQRNSNSLDQEYLPEVRFANEIERNALLVMYNNRGYGLSFEDQYYTLSTQYMETLQQALEDTRALANQYEGLIALRGAIDAVDQEVDTYEGLAQETNTVITDIKSQRTVLDEAAANYMEATGSYLQNQRTQYQQEIQAGASAEDLRQRMEKIYLMNDAIDLANEARVLNFKAQLLVDYTLMEQALKNLDAIEPIAQQLRPITFRAVDIEELETIAQVRQRYYSALQDILENYRTLDGLNTRRNDAGQQVLDEAQSVAAAGIQNAQAISTSAVDNVNTAVVTIAVGLALAVIIAIILAVFLTVSIVSALTKGVRFAEEIALGDLDVKLDIKQRDEIGTLADALKNMQKALQYKAGVIERIAQKDLTVDVEKASEKDGLGASLIEMKESLTDILKQVNFAVDQVASGSDQVSQASQNLSQGATEQASSLEEISSSLSEVNGQSQQNANNATEATGLAKKAAEDAVNGNGQMKELTGAMQKINDSSDEISKVVKVIDDIAFQINLLALNANVEAARAGKYGKGFAVVAEEVRNLAVRAADAVKETTGMVEVAISNIQSGNGLVGQTAEQLEEIVSGANKVAEFLDEIATASREQAEAVEQVNSGLDQIDQVTQSNTASAEESASAAEELAGQSQQLKSMIATFKLEADSRGAYALEYKPQTVQQGGRQQYQQQGQAQPRQTQPQGQQQPRQPGQTQHQKPRADQSKRGDETGIKPLDPSEVIQLDDDDFENF
jgi:methyl-accepting chemotaxis protein